jgi:hypothetical protein
MKVLALGFGISDVALAKHCQRAQIPLPKRGYWARQRVGKKTLQIPLGPKPPGMSDRVTIGKEPSGGSHWLASAEEELLRPLPAPPVFHEELSAVAKRLQQQLGKVVVSNNLEHSHPLVFRLLEADKQRREKQRDSAYPSVWDNPIFESAIEQRRLRMINALFCAVEKCGCKPFMRGREGRELSVKVGEQYIRFILDRVKDRTRISHRSGEASHRESGKLKLEIQSFNDKAQVSWQDDGVKKLEKRMSEVAVQLITLGEVHYREQARRHYEWKVQRKAELEREVQHRKVEEERLEKERQIKLQRARVDRLLTEARSLRQANEIRAYVDAVRNANRDSCDAIQKDAIDYWAAWALNQAEQIDPIKSGAWKSKQSEIESIWL